MAINQLKNHNLLMIKQLATINRYKSVQSSSEYCLDSLKKHDYENFICTILLKNTPRSIALAVRSFNVEVARVAAQVSQETIGLMRLKFWDEAIDKCYTKDVKQVPKHPVAMELYKAVTKENLSKRYLKMLVSSRRNNMNKFAHRKLDDMEKYAEQTVSSMFYLVLEGCGVRDVNADHAASHLGKAQGIVQQLRTIPLSGQLNYVPIPEEILIKNHISQEEIMRGKDTKKLSDCVYEMACRAHQHLQKSRSLEGKVPVAGKHALLPAVPVGMYLDRLERVEYNVLHPSLQQRSWKMLPNLYISMLRNKY